MLLGYYRLLLGAPQKTFYAGGTGRGQFKSMEERGVLRAQQKAALHDLCIVMGAALAELVRQLAPALTPRDVRELPLLTLGAQFQGSANNAIGQQATEAVFIAIAELVNDHIVARESRRLTLTNAAGRAVVIALAGDPDVRIQEVFGDALRNKVAIEIKGGSDRSNAHNRAGEAEKSHQKAKNEGYRDFWTVIAKHGLDMDKLRAESPTTNSWFDVAQVLARDGPDWQEFRSRLADAVGIPLG